MPSKIAADDTFIFLLFYLLKKIRLGVSCESSARQRIHTKYQVLFSLKNNEKVYMNVVCCSRDWRFKGLVKKKETKFKIKNKGIHWAHNVEIS